MRNREKMNGASFENRKAYHDYEILDALETGMVLSGIETKSVAFGAVGFSGAYVAVLENELWLVGANIAGLPADRPANRNRKLLCRRKELAELKRKTEAGGMALVPLKIYLKNGKFKLLVGIAKGRKLVDKRDYLKTKDIERDIARAGSAG